jgi:hypothetical protein
MRRRGNIILKSPFDKRDCTECSGSEYVSGNYQLLREDSVPYNQMGE